MKIAHKGYIYESMTPAELEHEYQNFMEGRPFKLTTELMTYAGSRQKADDNNSEPEYLDLEDEVEKNTSLDVPSILVKWDIQYNEVDGDYVYVDNGDYYIVKGREIIPVNELIDRPGQYSDTFPEYANLDQKLSNEFWKFTETLYHATECDNMESILANGLDPSRGSGIGNRGVYGVFTSSEPDGYIDAYGDCKVSIDTAAMKRDNNMISVEREPEIFEYILSQAISSKYGINVTREPSSSDGMDYNTWIVNGAIHPKYLSRVD